MSEQIIEIYMGECELKKKEKNVLPEESGVPPYDSYVGTKLVTFFVSHPDI